MTRAVFDSSVLVSGFGWHGESYLCLVAMARRRVAVSSSAWILEEVSRRLKELGAERRLTSDPWPVFKWFSNTAEIVEPGPTGKQRSRDPKDDPVLGTALSAGVSTIVSRDRDLLDLHQPFGIEIIQPGEFLRELNR